MRRSGKVYFKEKLAGTVWQDENGYGFIYNPLYLGQNDAVPVSLTPRLQEKAYESNTMMAFFDGLIPQGWLLNIAVKTGNCMKGIGWACY
ncbi:MAG: phosphatidylinositol kinase [Ferruginibacter sp.]|nr:phosphatidylinositol kinase [Ferruginibacter sp.]